MTDISILKEKSKFLLLHNFMKCFSGTINQIVIINIWLVNCSSFQFVIFNLLKKKTWSLTRIFLELLHWKIIWYLFESFETIILCSVHSIQFMKYVFYCLWKLRIIKHESWVIKSNSATQTAASNVVPLLPIMLCLWLRFFYYILSH